MRIIGIDPGTHITGYGLVDVKANNLSYLNHGVLKAQAKLNVAQRLHTIGKGFEKLLCQFQPQVAVLEKSFLKHNVRTAIALGEARGMFLYLLEKHDMTIEEFDSRVIKKGITGHGGASKEHVRHLILNALHISETHPPELDATDALAMAFYHGTSYTIRQAFSTGF